MQPEYWTKINKTYIKEVNPADRHGDHTDKKVMYIPAEKKAKYL